MLYYTPCSGGIAGYFYSQQEITLVSQRTAYCSRLRKHTLGSNNSFFVDVVRIMRYYTFFMLYYTKLYVILLQYISYYAVLHIGSTGNVLYYIVCIILYYTALHFSLTCILLCYMYHTSLHHEGCAVLYYDILYCTISYRTVLYYTYPICVGIQP